MRSDGRIHEASKSSYCDLSGVTISRKTADSSGIQEFTLQSLPDFGQREHQRTPQNSSKLTLLQSYRKMLLQRCRCRFCADNAAVSHVKIKEYTLMFPFALTSFRRSSAETKQHGKITSHSSRQSERRQFSMSVIVLLHYGYRMIEQRSVVFIPLESSCPCFW